MSIGSHLIRVTDLPLLLEEDFFPLVQQFETGKLNSLGSSPNIVVCLAFFEPSTRTRMSFQMAAQRLGHRVNVFSQSASSLSKGETLEDTLLNLDRLKPDFIVVRCPEDLNLDTLAPQLRHASLLNGGWGALEHPSQAFLDAYTLWKHFGSLKGRKVLMLGDLRYSRVASSNWALLQQLGCEVGWFSSPELAPKGSALNLKTFSSRSEALRWADACMVLRVQRERHKGQAAKTAGDLENFLQMYGLSDEARADLKEDALILHPGPVNRGVEISEKAYNDPRSKILEQVENGLYVRMALFEVFLRQRRKS